MRAKIDHQGSTVERLDHRTPILLLALESELNFAGRAAYWIAG
jgi:hypothetical protein